MKKSLALLLVVLTTFTLFSCSTPGKEVTVRIKPQSEDIELWIDGGKQIQRTAVTDEYWEYTFTMPEHNIKLLIRPK